MMLLIADGNGSFGFEMIVANDGKGKVISISWRKVWVDFEMERDFLGFARIE